MKMSIKSQNNVNAITWVYILMLGLIIRKRYMQIQKCNEFPVKTYGIAIANFRFVNWLERV